VEVFEEVQDEEWMSEINEGVAVIALSLKVRIGKLTFKSIGR